MTTYVRRMMLGLLVLFRLVLCVTCLPNEAYDPKECRTSEGNSSVNEYQGRVNKAYDGNECLLWSDNPRFYQRYWSNTKALQAYNYCRNPDNDIHGPWCVVHKTTFKYCNIPRCAQDVECYEGNGENYHGDQDRTIDGTPCKIWRLPNANQISGRRVRFRFVENGTTPITLKSSDSRLDKFKSCRNPGGSRMQPWCYTFSGVGSRGEKQYCDIPKCSDPAPLGYPIYSQELKCASGFIRQTQKVMFGSNGERSLEYCVAPQRLLHLIHRKAPYGRFSEFCLHLVDRFDRCPAGFQEKQRFLPNVYKLAHISGPITWRSVSENLLQMIMCCTEHGYFKRNYTKSYIMMEKISRYKTLENDVEEFEKDGDTWDDLDDAENRPENSTTVNDIYLSGNIENQIPFASVRICPPAEGYSRLLHVFYPKSPFTTSQRSGVLPPLTDEVICEYHKLWESSVEMDRVLKNTSEVILGIFTDEPQCPTEFRQFNIPKAISAMLRQSEIICAAPASKLHQVPVTADSYCLPVVSQMFEPENMEGILHSEMDFKCPKGFRPNEIRLVSPPLRLKLCCSMPTGTDSPLSGTKSQAPFNFNNPFSLLLNGDRCPTFYRDELKMNAFMSTPTVASQSVEKFELVGEDDPVKFSASLAFGICHYLPPEVKLGVKSLTFRCEGLGHSWSITFSGATCGIDINEDKIFPEGNYCLLRIASECPRGFSSHNKMITAGLLTTASEQLCCRTEESIGDIQLPMNLDAPFKLPAVNAPCQAIQGFHVDAESSHCVYYPKGKNPRTLLVWPRVTGMMHDQDDSRNYSLSIPKICATIPRKREKPHWNRFADLTTLLLTMMQDKWLIFKRPRWTARTSDKDDVCFLELPSSGIPSAASGEENFCFFAFGSCPDEISQTIGSSIYMNTVLCCTVNSQTEYPPHALHSFVTLGHATSEDKTLLLEGTGAVVLPKLRDEHDGCPKLNRMKVYRRVADRMVVEQKPLRSMFNASNVFTDSQFTEKTGIWMEGNVVYIIYCEYTGDLSNRNANQKRSWPVADYAIPKSMNQCPPNTEMATIEHKQDQQGFYYSQPIHLDGTYMKGKRDVTLRYCVFSKNQYTTATESDMPAGHYCVLRVRGYCPIGFEQGMLSVLEGPQSVVNEGESTQRDPYLTTSNHPDIERISVPLKLNELKLDRLNYYFCCRADSVSVDTPIDGFPDDQGPFYLYRIGDKCQQINGTRVTEEYICLDTPNKVESKWLLLFGNQSWSPYTVKGLTPARIPFHRHCDVEINLCYYEKDVSHSNLENSNVSVHNKGLWPLGFYSLPNVKRRDTDLACPPGFTQTQTSLLQRLNIFFELEIMPSSLGPYFIEFLGQNNSTFNVFYCSRDQPEHANNNASYEELEAQWPKGDYCVISTLASGQCPPGLHRHTRSIGELCCRTDDVNDPSEVDWPFVNDFFLFGKRKCLSIKNTFVDRYLVRLSSPSRSDSSYRWNVLCHYLPKDWMEQNRSWPSGDYMLPIGRRGGLRTMKLNMVDIEKTKKPSDLVFNQTKLTDNETDSDSLPTYTCPASFERTRFTFVSKNSELMKIPVTGDRVEEVKLSAVTYMEFCTRDNESLRTEVQDESWPSGDYCVLTMNKNCPVRMEASVELPLKIPRFLLKSVDKVDAYGKPTENIIWYDAPQDNVFYFMRCCKNDRSLVLRLPQSEDGFYLQSSNDLCSRVPGTVLDREEVSSYLASPLPQTVEEPFELIHRTLFGQDNGVMKLCYYHPVKEINKVFEVVEEQLATSFSVTEKDLDEISAMCGCVKNAFCLPYKHGECLCKPGYFGDGRHVCKQITPLTDQCASLCSSEAACVERRSRQFSSHACECRSGFTGDGFTCKPSCASHVCQKFSRCVENEVLNSIHCECIPGTINSEGRCHLDIYKTILHEKDLPQFLVHYDHCLSEEAQNSLKLLQPVRYFYVFVPQDNIKTCHDMKSHIVVMDRQLTEKQLKSYTEVSPFELVSENQTLIKIYFQNNSWIIDGHPAQTNPTLFTNGMLFMLSAPLKKLPHSNRHVAYYVSIVICVLLLLALVCFVAYWLTSRRGKCPSSITSLRNTLLSRRRPWRRQGERFLVEYVDGEDEE